MNVNDKQDLKIRREQIATILLSGILARGWTMQDYLQDALVRHAIILADKLIEKLESK